ncbi:MAG: sugar phosphate isomerase/epimerase family protein [Bacteroidia bacterium]
MNLKRRTFLQKSALATSGLIITPWLLESCHSPATNQTNDTVKEMFFKISLAEWSLHKTLFDGKLTHMEFPGVAKNEFGVDGVEYVNQFFKDKAKDTAYLTELKTRADDLGLKTLLIMIDGEGSLGAPDEAERKIAVENHYKWVEAAKFLGCHSIRVNAHGVGTAEEVHAGAVQGLGSLATFAKDFGMNVIVENHGGYSSDGSWLTGVMAEIAMENCGTLPDFGNFCLKRTENGCDEEYDRYTGVTEMMKYAKAVSAKTNDFDEAGNEIHTDYKRMMQIVKDAGYRGFVGIEYEGRVLDEYAGIRASKALLEKVGAELS